ncbi:MAG: endolytic transglycosylase MltG [Chitinophagaceae bacterium]
MKKKIIFGAIALLLVIAIFFAWQFFGSAVIVKDSKNEYLYIRTGSTIDDVKKQLTENNFLRSASWFSTTAKLVKYNTVKPGRYKMQQGMSLMNLVRMLRNGSQAPVNFVITKLRTKESLASKTGKAFECDSLQMIRFLNSPDSLKAYNLDTNIAMIAVMPFTYTLKWNSTPGAIFDQFHLAYKNFWTDARKQKADSLHLSPAEVSTLASIIDEETNAKADRPNIASVYLNRIAKGMPLQADPTVKFAMKNFELRRILNVYLQTPSPYNTYINKGLPPGPICTPQLETIDAVLSSPKTDYIYFVASPNFDGTHVFTTNYNDHMKEARIYQKELNKRNIK